MPVAILSLDNCTCGHVSEIKQLEDGRWLVFCPQCKQFGEPWPSMSGAIARWNRAQVDVVCLGCGSLPRLGYRKEDGRRNMTCRGCGYHTSPSMTLDGAMVDWVRQNKRGDKHALELWRFRFNLMKGAENGARFGE